MRIRFPLALAVLVSLAAFMFASAWTGPTATAPGNNTSAPLNVGAVSQVKNGNIGVNGLAVFGNSILQGSSYLNWGATSGSGGYGIWDNGGTLNFKNSGGTWQSLQSIISTYVGGQWTTSGSSIYYNGGNVGIGTASPGETLDVNGPIRSSNEIISTLGSGAGQLRMIAGNYGTIFRNDGSTTYLLLTASGSQYGTWNSLRPFYVNDSSGAVGIDQTGAGTTLGGNLTVNGTSNFSGAATFGAGPYTNDWFRVNGSGGIYWQAYGGGWTMTDSLWIRSYGSPSVYMSNGFDTGSASAVGCGGALGGGYTFRTCGTADVTGSLTVGGNVVATAFLYNSDERLKKNIAPLTGNLDAVLQLKPVTYNWINPAMGTTTQIGFIAQQVQQVVPEIVHTDASTTLESVDYARLTPLLVGSVQELDQKIDAQQQEIDTLEAQVAALENK